MQSQLIRFSAFVAALVLAGAAQAGDTNRYEVNFDGLEIFFSDFVSDPVGTQVITAEPGRYFDQAGLDPFSIAVCWNVGAQYTGWRSEVVFAFTATGSAGDEWLSIAPYAGDDTGALAEGTCVPMVRVGETVVPLDPFTYSVDSTGDVRVAMASTWDDETGFYHSRVETAGFFFVLFEPPAGCDGATGACTEVKKTPGCDDADCCYLVCGTSGDPFCCEFDWDSSCVSLALQICDYYPYSCDAPAYTNDCATNPIVADNGVSYAFDTTLANNDGPPIGCANGGSANVWYLIENTEDREQLLTATTCAAANYDTALALFDMGEVGSSISGYALEGAEVACNDDGPGCPDYSSNLVHTLLAGRQYLLGVSGYQGVGTGTVTIGWEEIVPPIAPMSCTNPGPDTVSQTIGNPSPQDNGVSCSSGNNSADNSWARLYTAADFNDAEAFILDCVTFGVRYSGSYIGGVVNVYRSSNGQVAPFSNLELVGSVPYGIYGAPAGYSDAVFDGGLELDLSGDAAIIVEFSTPAVFDGLVSIAGGTSANVSGGTTYLRSDTCAFDEFTPYGDLGIDVEWFVDLKGTYADLNSCLADFNDDGQVDSGDLGLLIGSWGPNPGVPFDLTGNGQVDAADLGLLIGAWGVCP